MIYPNHDFSQEKKANSKLLSKACKKLAHPNKEIKKAKTAEIGKALQQKIKDRTGHRRSY